MFTDVYGGSGGVGLAQVNRTCLQTYARGGELALVDKKICVNRVHPSRRGCSLSRALVNGVIIHLRLGGRTGIVTL